MESQAKETYDQVVRKGKVASTSRETNNDDIKNNMNTRMSLLWSKDI